MPGALIEMYVIHSENGWLRGSDEGSSGLRGLRMEMEAAANQSGRLESGHKCDAALSYSTRAQVHTLANTGCSSEG